MVRDYRKEKGVARCTIKVDLMKASYASSAQNLLIAYLGMESLVECQSVKDAFSKKLLKHCKLLNKICSDGLRVNGLTVTDLSMIMVFLVLIWIA